MVSGRFGGWTGFAGADQVSRSADSKMRPDPLSAYRREPSGENHTRLTGPVAGEARARSMAPPPILRQAGRDGLADVCAAAVSAAMLSIAAKAVARR